MILNLLKKNAKDAIIIADQVYSHCENLLKQKISLEQKEDSRPDSPKPS
jgi:hypothetical protein